MAFFGVCLAVVDYSLDVVFIVTTFTLKVALQDGLAAAHRRAIQPCGRDCPEPPEDRSHTNRLRREANNVQVRVLFISTHTWALITLFPAIQPL